MTTNRPWKALLWKEFREMRAVAVVLVAAPALALIAASAYEARSVPWSILRGGATVVFPGLAAMWASAKAAAERKGGEFASAHLPLPSPVRWLFSLALPLAVAALAGTFYGAFTAHLLNGYLTDWLIVGTLLGACAFAVTFLVTQALSEWAGRFAGALVIGLNIVATPPLSRPPEHGLLEFLVCATAGALVGQALFASMARTGRTRLAQAVSLSVLVLAVALSGGWIAYRQSKPPGGTAYRYSPPRIDSRDWAQYVAPRRKPGRLGWVLDYVNLRANTKVSHEFAGEVAPLDFLGDDRVYLIHLPPGEDNPRLIVWDGRTERISEVMIIPAGRIALVPVRGQPAGFVRPDGRYLLLALRSTAGQGRDLWVVDFKRRRATIAYPNGGFAFDGARWAYDYAVVYGTGTPLAVLLKKATAHPIDLVLEAGGCR